MCNVYLFPHYWLFFRIEEREELYRIPPLFMQDFVFRLSLISLDFLPFLNVIILFYYYIEPTYWIHTWADLKPQTMFFFFTSSKLQNTTHTHTWYIIHYIPSHSLSIYRPKILQRRHLNLGLKSYASRQSIGIHGLHKILKLKTWAYRHQWKMQRSLMWYLQWCN